MAPLMSTDLGLVVELVNAFQRSVARPGAEPVTEPPPRKSSPPPREADVLRRLDALNPDWAVSLQQVLDDLEDTSRRTYMGAVGEAREVLRATVHTLAPDEAVKAQPWYKGDKGNPTQAERARYAAELRYGKDADEAAGAVEVFEAKLGRLFRTVYASASGKFHAGTQRAEARRIVGYVVLVLDDILPDVAAPTQPV